MIAVIRDMTRDADDELQTKQLNEMIRLATPVEKPSVVADKSSTDIRSTPSTPPTPVSTPHYINMRGIKADFPKSELRTEEDVEEYIEAYKKALIKHIRNNRRINI
jgi:hypothetical protein